MKQYNNLTDIDKTILRHYESWKKANCESAYKLSQLEYWYKRAVKNNLQHFIIGESK